jgi:signal transduction histidine kinase
MLRTATDDQERAELLAELEAATVQIRDMTHSMARSVRRGAPVQAMASGDLLKQAVELARAMLHGHGVSLMEPALLGVATEVWVTEGHASSLANLITNGALQAPGERLHIETRVVSPYYAELAFRDYGVSEEDRPEALRRIEQAFTLDATKEEDATSSASYRGFGISLLLARLLVIRAGGWLAAVAPEQGPGITFVVSLPRVAPSSIPADALPTAPKIKDVQ